MGTMILIWTIFFQFHNHFLTKCNTLNFCFEIYVSKYQKVLFGAKVIDFDTKKENNPKHSMENEKAFISVANARQR